MHPKDADGMANSVDPDQTASSADQTASSADQTAAFYSHEKEYFEHFILTKYSFSRKS